MDYNKEKHKPMMIKTDVKESLDRVKKELILKSLDNGGTGRVSYGDTIMILIEEYNKK